MIKELLEHPEVAIACLTFMGGSVAAARYLLGRIFNYLTAFQKRRLTDALEIEKLKNANEVKLIEQLKKAVDILEPEVNNLKNEVKLLKTSAQNMSEINIKMTQTLMENQSKLVTQMTEASALVTDVRKYFTESMDQVAKAKAGGLHVLDRLKEIEFKVEKWGKVFVTGKKQ